MTPENPPYTFNYQALDKLLTEDYDPKELGNKFDEMMSELVSHGSLDENYRESQAEHHYILKVLRDIFWWKLPNTK